MALTNNIHVFAQSADLGRIGGEGLGPFGNGFTKTPLELTLDFVSSIVGFMTVAASIWFLFQILYAGYEWTSAGGDTKKVASARDRITHSFIGLVIVVGAWSLLAVAGQFFGYNTLINPQEIMDQLPIK